MDPLKPSDIADYYQRLGVEPNARFNDVLLEFKLKSQKYDPSKPEDLKEITALNEAYLCLFDPLKRMEYDSRRSKQIPPLDKILETLGRIPKEMVDDLIQRTDEIFKVTPETVRGHSPEEIFDDISKRFEAALDEFARGLGYKSFADSMEEYEPKNLRKELETIERRFEEIIKKYNLLQADERRFPSQFDKRLDNILKDKPFAEIYQECERAYKDANGDPVAKINVADSMAKILEGMVKYAEIGRTIRVIPTPDVLRTNSVNQLLYLAWEQALRSDRKLIF